MVPVLIVGNKSNHNDSRVVNDGFINHGLFYGSKAKLKNKN